MGKILAITLSLVVLTTNRVCAADPQAAAGVGLTPCAEFAQQYKQNPQLIGPAYFSWADGFMTGWNFHLLATKQPIFDMSTRTLDQRQFHILDYCERNPLQQFVRAVLDLFSSFPSRAPEK
jgi:hypothetical protein